MLKPVHTRVERVCVSVCVYSKVDWADGSTESPRLHNKVFLEGNKV